MNNNIQLDFDLGCCGNANETFMIDPGYYNSVVHNIMTKESKIGDKMIFITFRITDNKFHGRTISKYFCINHSTNEKAKSIARIQLKNVAECIGLIQPGRQLQSIKIEEWLNKPLKIKIILKDFNKNEIAGFKVINNYLENRAEDMKKSYDDGVPF